MKKPVTFFAFLVLLLTGCSSDEPCQPIDVENPATTGEEDEATWESTSKIELTQAEKPVLESMNNFGYKLMMEYSQLSNDGSFDVSPVSVSTYLSMMANATAGDTHEQILSALGVTDMEDLNSLNSKLMHYLPCEENGACLEINNRIWLSNKYSASLDLSSILKDVYNADIKSVDFNQATTVPGINKWVSDKTHGLISGILYGEWTKFVDLNHTSANTVYFKGDWASKFDKKQTTKSLFTSPEGKATVNMMHKVVGTLYAEQNGIQLVKVYYEHGKNCVELYLPAQDTPYKDIVARITPEVQQDLSAKSTTYEVTLSLPRFKTKSEQVELNDVLKNMGLTMLAITDFSPLGISEKTTFELTHQTYISVDEDGTELVAVTGGFDVIAPPPSEDEKPKVKVDFNRPFMYIVRNRQTNAILMAGVVTNPEE